MSRLRGLLPSRPHGESGWVGRLLASGVAIAVLSTARPADAWVWVVLAVTFVMFLAGTFLMSARPSVAFGLLLTVAVVNALICGVDRSNSLVLVLLAMADIAVIQFPRRGNRQVVAAAVAVAAGYAVSAWQFGESQTWYFTQLMWTAVLVAFGLNRRQYEVQARQTELLLEQTRLAQSEHARAAALEERGRIARDLHDVLAHSLGALTVQLEVAEGLLEDRGDVAGALDRVRRSRRLAVQGLVEARSAVAALRADEVPSLPSAMAALAEEHSQDHGTAVNLTVVGEAVGLESGVTVALLGAVREALTNAAKHAPGQAVELRLAYQDGVRASVRNRGATSGEGFGLAGMRERLALVGGTLTAGADGDDWLVVAEVAGD
ncbi:histidine kinase [Kribbella sp. NPDC026611]|uniref:sensor histidine kinase n=1 Tax=Kribbella sp. NPDC026611 TaxID=3154911 RepID=UPI0033F2AE80